MALSTCKAVKIPSPVVLNARINHMGRTLLAAEHMVFLAHFFQHIAVADLGFQQLDAVLFHGDVQAHIAHHGCDQRIGR